MRSCIRWLIAILVGVMVVGCGGDDTPANTNGTVNLAGNWAIAMTTSYDNSGDPVGSTANNTFTLQQSGGTAWGTIAIPNTSMEAPVTGNVSGNSVMLAWGFETLTGTVTQDATSMTGSFTGKNGDTLWGGTWTATRL